MFIEFVDSLRCTRAHEDSWLVAAADRMEGRSIVQGVLGCPVCGAEYPIAEGVADFRAHRAVDSLQSTPRDPAAAEPGATEPGVALRAAALLGLADPGGTVALGGSWARVAAEVLAVAPVHLLLVDPPFAAQGADGVSVVRTDGPLPLAAACLRGAALDEPTAGRGGLESAVRALRRGGRLVAPAALPVPVGVVELARDARDWVGEREAGVSPPVELKLRRGE